MFRIVVPKMEMPHEVGNPSVPVVGFAGDGAFGISINEITACGRGDWPRGTVPFVRGNTPTNREKGQKEREKETRQDRSKGLKKGEIKEKERRRTCSSFQADLSYSIPRPPVTMIVFRNFQWGAEKRNTTLWPCRSGRPPEGNKSSDDKVSVFKPRWFVFRLLFQIQNSM